MLGLLARSGERHLMRAERAFDLLAVHYLRPGPAFRRAQDDHRPASGACVNPFVRARRSESSRISSNDRVQRRRHQLVHRLRIVAFDEVRLVAVAAEQLRQLLVADAREHRRAGDLVAVQMQDRQHRAVARRIQKLVRMPARRERAGLRFAIADDAARRSDRDCRTPRRRRAASE